MFSNPSVGWVLMNTLQIIYFLPLSQKPLTEVSDKFCKALGKFNSVNLPELFLNLDNSDVPFEKAQKIGIKTSNVWINLGPDLTVFFVLIFLFPFIYLFSKIAPGNIKLKFEGLLKNYRYSFFIRFWLQSHLVVGVYSLINFETKTSSLNIEAAFNKSFSFIFIAIFISSPVFIFITLWVDLDLIDSKDSIYLSKNGSFFKDFHYEKGFSYLFFDIFLGIRRIVFTFSQIYLSEFEDIQISLNFVSSLFIFIYLAKYRPFKAKIAMISNLAVEFMLLLVFILILGRSLFEFLKDDSIFNMCFTSFLIGGMLFQYFICLFSFGMKLKNCREVK